MSIVAREPCFSCAELVASERRHADVVKDAVKKAAVQMVVDAHRTAIDLIVAHLETYLPMIESGTPAAGILYMIKHNVSAMRSWTPEHAAEVLREAEK